MQRVQTRTRRRVEPSTIFTRWRFGMKRRLRLLFALLTEFPVLGPLPQTWQKKDMTLSHRTTTESASRNVGDDGMDPPMPSFTAPCSTHAEAIESLKVYTCPERWAS